MSSLHNVLFYLRLIVISVKENRGIYLPCLVADGVMAGLLYVLDSAGVIMEANQTTGGGIMQVTVEICGSVCTMFAAMILLYINSLATKRRKKEFGLLCVLRVGKKHPGSVLFQEAPIRFSVSLVMGITIGALFSQAMFLLLLEMVGLSGRLTFVIPLQSVGKICLTYVTASALVLVYDPKDVFKANLMELLRSSVQGEKRSKTRWLITMTGVMTLGFGYFLVMSTGMTSDALTFFFPVILLATVETYCLFQAKGMATLKRFRRRKDLYYKPGNFAAASGMIYRMRQNVAGLSGIYILSAAVLITMSTCAGLYVREEDILRNQYPKDIALFIGAGEVVSPAGEVPGKVKTTTKSLAREHGRKPENMINFYQMSLSEEFKGGSFMASWYYGAGTQMAYVTMPEDYNHNNGESEMLVKGEILYYASELPLAGGVEICGETYRVAGALKGPEVTQLTDFAMPQDQTLLIAPELSDLHRLFRAYSEQLEEDIRETVSCHCLFDLTGSPEEKVGFEAEFQDRIPGLNRGAARGEIRTEFYQLYRSILFVSISFMALFSTATVLIIYYKQITGGYDGREWFRVMEKVGMGVAEVKKTIIRQVIMMLFLPLGVAMTHILTVFQAMCSLLGIFSMHDVGLYAVFTAYSALVFEVVYLAVYYTTARTYYQIVRKQWKK